MPVESVQFIGDFDLTSPRDNEFVRDGDDHIRDVLKKAIVKTFPGAGNNGFAKAITATEDELNYVDGVTAPIQDQFKDLNDALATYLPLAGGTMTGLLTGFEEIRVKSGGSDAYDGFSIYDNSGGFRGAFNWLESTGDIQIWQQGDPTAEIPNTLVTIASGNITMTAANGNTTDPVNADDLVVKSYVDDNFVQTNNGDQTIAGTLTVNEGFHVNASTGNIFDGLEVTFSGFTRMACVFNESTGEVQLIQNDAFGGNETVLTLDNGAIQVNGVPVSTAATVLSQLAGASGSFEDNNGNTVTVINGLITSLS